MEPVDGAMFACGPFVCRQGFDVVGVFDLAVPGRRNGDEGR